MAAKKKMGRPLGSKTTEGWIKKSHNFRPSVLARIESAMSEEKRSTGGDVSRAAWVNRAIVTELNRLERQSIRDSRAKAKK